MRKNANQVGGPRFVVVAASIRSRNVEVVVGFVVRRFGEWRFFG